MSLHDPALAQVCLDLLITRPDGIYLDATVGPGGHSEALLGRLGGDARLLAFDWDSEVISLAQERLRAYAAQIRFFHTPYSRISAVLEEEAIPELDGILADFGLSSTQLSEAERGFSFQLPGPLDMRFDRRGRTTAANLLNTASADELERIFRTYGEERYARRVARRICEVRKREKLLTTDQLAEVVRRAVPTGKHRRIDKCTRVFQALRIAVNNELAELERFLAVAPGCLRIGGRIVCLSYHSLEDRATKLAFRAQSVADPDRSWLLRVLTRKPIRPTREEIHAHRTWRSARLRAAERVA